MASICLGLNELIKRLVDLDSYTKIWQIIPYWTWQRGLSVYITPLYNIYNKLLCTGFYSTYCHMGLLPDIFEVKLTFEMLTVLGQQHSFSTHERIFLWKCQSFWDRICLNLRGTRTPNLRTHADCSKHLSYQGQAFDVPVMHWLLFHVLSHGPLTRYVKSRVAHAPERFPHHHGSAIPTCITTRAWR